MKIILFAAIFFFISCSSPKNSDREENQDSILLLELLQQREQAMIRKDINKVMEPFTDSACWTTTGGVCVTGKENIRQFHLSMFKDSLFNYTYRVSDPDIEVRNDSQALLKYTWNMNWYKQDDPADTVKFESGCLQLVMNKMNNRWVIISATNSNQTVQ